MEVSIDGTTILSLPVLTWLAHVTLVLTLSIRVIMKRPATGVALAWLLLIAAIPVGGALLYLMIGERRIGHRRAHGIQKLRTEDSHVLQMAIGDNVARVDWSRHVPSAASIDRLGTRIVNIPTLPANHFELYANTEQILKALVRDVDAAQRSVLMEFYIWHEGGWADEVLEAVIRAAQRGVSCRLLIDALGARPWWKGTQPKRLRDAGVALHDALPVGIFRTVVGRTDLRLHRKIVVIDSDVAWTGSMNLVDPRFFKQNAGVGEWVDAMVRLKGGAVIPLASTMISDWLLEASESLEDVLAQVQLQVTDVGGSADIQVLPSGPGLSEDGLLQMILALINNAQSELILTTPYLVPDESLLRAIRGAAGRGVKVKLIVPALLDSLLTRFASRSYYNELLDVGVEIHLFQNGLLHTKSISVDRSMSMFGTVNLDMRSFWLNYEVALFVYDSQFTTSLVELQQSYLRHSKQLDRRQWDERSFQERLLENTLRLFSPLL